MKKAFRIFAVLLVLAFTVAVYAFDGYEYDWNYYSDGTFTTAVGEYVILCEGTSQSSGTTSDWRIFDKTNCTTGVLAIHRCQQSDGMGGWTNITCPPGV